MTAMISVMIVDDHPFIIQGFKSSYEDYPVEVVASLNSLENVVETYNEVKPDVVILDIKFKDSANNENGLTACEKILAADSSAKIIMLTQFDSELTMERAFQIGALSYVEKDEGQSVTFKAIEHASHGKRFFTDRVAKKLAAASLGLGDNNPSKMLDEKDLEIFKLTAEGYSANEIHKKLSVTQKTVNRRINLIKEKLEINRITDFVLLAYKYQLISNPFETE